MAEEATRNEQTKNNLIPCTKSVRKASVQLRLVKKLKTELLFLKKLT